MHNNQLIPLILGGDFREISPKMYGSRTAADRTEFPGHRYTSWYGTGGASIQISTI
jgi:hypothetical protein